MTFWSNSAFWSNSVFSDSSTIYVGPAEMTGEVSAVAELSSVETGTMGPTTRSGQRYHPNSIKDEVGLIYSSRKSIFI